MNLELFWDRKGKPRLHLVGGNGEIIMSGEAYTRVATARKVAAKIQTEAPWGLKYVEHPKPKAKGKTK